MTRVESGLGRLLGDPALLAGRRWALLANHAAVTDALEPARGALLGAGASAPVRLFAPEHGLEGVAQDMETVHDHHDELTGAPIRSLYGSTVDTLEPRTEDLDGVDVLLVDLPDIGTRYYTFAATMDAAMAACARAGVEVMVLDRPNPINGMDREGGRVQPGFESFVSALPTPVRHGLTLGEVALLLQRERHHDLELTVIACSGWERSSWADQTSIPWVAPSPNMPTLQTAILYPGLCLVEATELSEGRGTTRPFQLVGAPFINATALARTLQAHALAGLGVRPAWFRPEFGKHAGQVCQGVELMVLDRQALRPLAVGLTLLQVIRQDYPDLFRWRQEPYEFVSDIPAIDLLTGSSAARRCIENGGSLEELLADWRDDVVRFDGEVADLLIYRG